MKNATPNTPIKLPTNSTRDCILPSLGAQSMAIKAPTTIMGIPTPAVMDLDTTIHFAVKNNIKV